MEIDEIEKVVRQGMKWKEENSEKWHANMTGIECVFVKKEDIVFVITVYLEGSQK